MAKRSKKKSSKIPIPILIIIYGTLLFAVYQGLSTIILSIFGQTTIGIVDYYSNRIEDRTADAGRSRSIIKEYYFTVDGKTYRGRVFYLSDEAWPALKEGETRSEYIRYLPVFPYVSSTSSLSDFSDMTDGQIIYNIFIPIGCVGLFVLIRMFQRGAIKQDRGAAARAAAREAKKALNTTAKEENIMYCESCGTKLSAEAVFCINCGMKTQEDIPVVCSVCKTALSDGAAFCVNCGAAVSAAVSAPVPQLEADYSEAPAVNGSGRAGSVGFSDVYYSPEIQEEVRKKLKMSAGLILAVLILPNIIFPAASLIRDDYPMRDALFYGVGLSVILTVFYLTFRLSLRKPIWEGQVVKKETKYKYKHKDDDTTVPVFITTFIQDSGKKKTLTEWEQECWYSYFSVGGRVRYYPALGTYEKYDKSKDRIIYCNFCMMMNQINNEHCKRCNKPLFK